MGVLAGFAIIGVLIGLGFLLASLKILDATAQHVLSRVAFYVASPALMVTVLGGTDVQRLLSANLICLAGQRRRGGHARCRAGPTDLAPVGR